ncbi:MAG: hypothetical protein ACI9X0_002863 [Kiritimatiellia bacterium]|jgi:uncharacterized protein involved in exopolysaccharide biosynthesis
MSDVSGAVQDSREKKVFLSVWARAALGTAVVAAACLIAGLYCHARFPTHYASEARLWVDPFVPDVSSSNALITVLSPRELRPYRNSLAQVMNSAPLAQAGARYLLKTQEALLPSAYSRNEAHLSLAIQKACEVKTSHDDAVLNVICVHPDAVVPGLFANALADAFRDYSLQNRLMPYANAVAALAREVERLAFLQVDCVTALDAFREKVRTDGVDEHRAMLTHRLREERSAFAHATRERQDAESRSASIADVDINALYQVDWVANDRRVTSARQALAQHAARMRVLEQRYREKHPSLKSALAAMETLRADLVAACQEVRDGLAERLVEARARERNAAELVERTENALRALGLTVRRQAGLVDAANVALFNLDRMRERLYDARLAHELVTNNVRLVERAARDGEVRQHPAAARLFLAGALFVILALLLKAVSVAITHRPEGERSAPAPSRSESTVAMARAASESAKENRVALPETLPPIAPVRPVVTPTAAVVEPAAQSPVSEMQGVANNPGPGDTVPEPAVPEIDAVMDLEDSETASSEAVVAKASEEAVANPKTAMPAGFWGHLEHPALDALESAAVSATKGSFDEWEELLAHASAAHDKERLIRLARHLRVTRPFGDRIRRLAEGHVARLREDYDAALRIYQAGIARTPEHAALRGGVVRCALYMGEEQVLTESLGVLDGDDASVPADVHYVRGMMAIASETADVALAHLRTCVQRVPDIDAMLCMAWLSMQEGHLGDAEKAARYALNFAPLHAAALDVLGVVLYKRGEVTDAVHAFEKALTHSPEAWGAMVHLVELYRERNEGAKAAALVRRLRVNRERLGEELVAALDEMDIDGGRENG